MTGSLLLRGLIAGALAGIIAFVFALTFGEPQVDLAIAFEDRMAEAAAADPAAAEAGDEEPMVTRETQAGLGLFTGLVFFGASVGGMFALVFALAYGRVGRIGARGLAALLAVAAFVAFALVPQLKYPANPPAVGFDETIAARTSLYFILLVISVLAMAFAVMLARRMWDQRGAWAAGLTGALAYVVIVTLVFIALPAINEMPEGFDPLVIWNFRIASLGTHLVMWGALGLIFGHIAERAIEGGRFGRHVAA